VSKEQFLLAKERLQGLRVHLLAASLVLPQCFELGTDALFEDLQSVLGELIVELRQIRDGAHGSEDCVVLDVVRFRPERGYHGDSLSCTKRAEGLVLDISTLQDHGTSLQRLSANRQLTEDQICQPFAGLGL